MFVMFFLRFFVFKLYESPKYLMGRGRDEEAVRSIHLVAAYNGKTSNLRLEHLQEVDAALASTSSKASDMEKSDTQGMDTSAIAAVRRKLAKFSLVHVKSLFATRKLALSTSLLISIWC